MKDATKKIRNCSTCRHQNALLKGAPCSHCHNNNAYKDLTDKQKKLTVR